MKHWLDRNGKALILFFFEAVYKILEGKIGFTGCGASSGENTDEYMNFALSTKKTAKIHIFTNGAPQ